MTVTAEESLKHIGETAGMADHDRDLVHELSKRLDSLWRCDQYIANAEGHQELMEFWRGVKQQETEKIDRIRQLMRKEIDSNCF